VESSKPSLAQQAGNATLWRGSALATEKLIFFARLLVLARLVVPEDFGLVAIGMTVTMLVNELTNFGLIPALVQTPAKQKQHLDTAWSISVMRGLFITVVLFVAAPFIAELFAEPRATNIIRVLALATLAQSAASIEIATITRALHFRALATIQLSSAVINTVISIYFARTHGAWALVWGHIGGAVVYMIGSYVVAPYRPAVHLAGNATSQLIRFGRWIFLTGLLGAMFHTVLRWMISKRLGVAELGLFFLAARLAFLPAQLTISVLYDIAFPVYSRLQDDVDKMARVFRAMLIGMLALLLPMSLIFLALVPGLVEHVLGDRWLETTEIMQILILASLAGALGDSLVPLLKGTGRPEKIAAVDAFRLVILTILAWGMIGTFGIVGAGMAYLASMIISQFVLVHVLYKIIERPFSGILRSFLAIVVTAVIGAVVAFSLIAAIPGPFGLGLAAIVAGLTAIGAGLLFDRYLDLGLLKILSEPFPRFGAAVDNIMRGK